jgi:hypothetical protein
MARNPSNDDDRARQMLAQEAARLIVDQGIRDYRVAKTKAADRLGMGKRGSLPGNSEIEHAVNEHLLLFGGESHADHLREMREAAVSAMQLLEEFTPRLVGPVLSGIADENSAINLHVFADSPEAIATFLADRAISCRLYERRLKSRRGRNVSPDTYAGFEFKHDGEPIEATVFAIDGIRQAPISPIDRKPIKRADLKAVKALLAAADGVFDDGSKAQRSEP